MDENYNYLYEEDMEINLIDLMYYLLKQWRTLIAAILIGAILGGGIYVVKKNSADKAAAALEAEMEDAKTSVEDGQSVTELKENYQISEDVETNMELAYQYRQLYRKQLEYNQNSPIMQMNPSAVYSGELEYYISAGYDTGVIAILYQNILNGNDILEELKAAAELDYKEQYIRELIGCSVSRENDSIINVNNGESLIYKNAIVTFTVNAATEEKCEVMLRLIREKVAAIDQECRESYENYNMVAVSDSVNLVSSSDYLSRQKSNIDQLNSYRNTMTTLENSFTEDELVYYNKVYLSRDYVIEEEEGNADAVVTDAMVQAEQISPVNWLVLGIFLMCIVWGGMYFVKYLFDKRIKTPDEIRSRYRLPIIGYVKTEAGDSKGLDGWLDRMRCKSWGTGDSTENIGNMINAMDMPGLLFCMESGGSKLEMIVNEICGYSRNLKKSGALHQNGNLVAKMKECDGVILAVEIGDTVYTDIEREMEICRMQGVVVKGVVVIS